MTAMTAIARALLSWVLGLAISGPAGAQSQPDLRAGSAPPFGVQGFHYVPIHRPGQAVVHMNECRETACGPGAKVSYVFLEPEPHSLEAFRAERAWLAEQLKAQLPAGTVLTFNPPTVEKIGPVVIYESKRQQQDPDGTVTIVVSQTLRSDNHRVDLISSSTLPRVAEGNARTFGALIVIWMAVEADKAKVQRK